MDVQVKTTKYPIKGHFSIARSSITEVEVIVVSLEKNGTLGRGECRPIAYKGESIEQTLIEIESLSQKVAEAGRNRTYQRTCAALTHGFEDHD
ncbi:MAG: hypothetical protein GY786_08665 [Proteobacteria bacterium]|nr:hypothetical protein [Pseudomonadota bacterium]